MSGTDGGTTPASGLKTETTFFKDLISDISNGEIKVPQFQRPFVWKTDQALRLLDSIIQNYPIGSLLLWKTTDKLTTERNIGDFRLPDTDELSPVSYVLDGQQRLTVIYSALAPTGDDDQFRAGYDLREQDFLQLKGSEGSHVFPLALTFNTTGILNFRTQLQALDEASTLQDRLDRLIDRLTRYQVPVVELRHLTLEEVCPIFERINSSGTKLSTFDLMVAATWSTAFDLNEKVAEIATAVDGKDFQDVSGDAVLKVMSGINTMSTRRSSVLALRQLDADAMDALVGRTQSSMLRAVDLLSTEFGVHGLDFLPYEAQLVIISYICSHSPALDHEQLRRIRRWFWRSGLSEHYRGASDTVVSNDLERIHQYVITGDLDGDDDFGRVPTIRDLKRLRFRKNSAGTQAFILALARAQPRNLTNGAAIDTASALSIYNKKQFHHIWPEAHLRRIDPSIERSWVLNMCMLSASENRAISDADPNVYLPRYVELHGDNASNVFRSNLLPDPTDINYTALTYDAFLDARSSVVHEWLSRLCEGET